MKCPYCGEFENKVIDSRVTREGDITRRRRECVTCNMRFTTYEIIEEIAIMIVKKDGRREPFSRDKARAGILKACEKRNISMNVIEEFLDRLEHQLRSSGEKEIPAHTVGEKIMEKLHKLDDIAYVRFASVYREFKDVNDFFSELQTLLAKTRENGGNSV